jgi:predicted DNA-binding ribbon-helix-helix protein
MLTDAPEAILPGLFFAKGNSLPMSRDRIIGEMFTEDFIGEAIVKSPVVKRSVVIDGHKTSVSLEDQFWNDLKEIAYVQRMTLSKMIGEIDKVRQHSNLSSALRLFVLERVRMHRDVWQYSRARKSSKIPNDSVET